MIDSEEECGIEENETEILTSQLILSNGSFFNNLSNKSLNSLEESIQKNDNNQNCSIQSRNKNEIVKIPGIGLNG